MSTEIKTKLTTIKSKLEDIRQNVLDGKREIAYAIKYNGLTNVNPYDDSSTTYDTFATYATLIRKLKATNSMVLEFTIPESATTDYKKTIVLPMNFQSAGYGSHATVINEIAYNLITSAASTTSNEDDTTSSSSVRKAAKAKSTSTESDSTQYTIKDFYGNECIDGTYIPTMEDVQEYLSEEEQEEMLAAADDLGIMLLSDTSSSTDATYEFTVNWGDDSNPQDFVNGNSLDDNMAAIAHTYASAGTYDVTITGNFRKLYGNPQSFSDWLEDGEYITDTDGTRLQSGKNYAMYNYLISVISWGNTLLTDCNCAFCNCKALTTIPMYDTNNSFEDTTNISAMFYGCTALTSIPFNSNTNKGLFSGCAKITNASSCFAYCTGMTGSIPVKLFNGCSAITNIGSCFAYSKFTGNIPVGLLSGMTSLTNASEMFASCNLTGELSDDLFAETPNVTSIYRLFYNCTGVTGTIGREFIGGLSKLTDMRQAFYNCTGITGIASDAFYSLTSNGINCRDAFYNCTGITEIPSGLMPLMTGTNLLLERMFVNCTGITTIASDAVSSLKPSNARGMFGGCTGVTSACPDANSDWDSYETMKKWYGVFAGTNMSDIDSVAIELGGNGERKFSQGNVGKIVLKDKTMVEAKDFVYDADNTPIGWVYADEYLDSSKSVATLANGAGNVVSENTDGAVHKLFVAPWSNTSRQWVDSQIHAEDVTTITNTSDTSVSYGTFTYDSEGVQTRHTTRYNGEAYSQALLQFVFEKGYADNVVDGTYTSYSVVTSLPTSGLTATNIYYMVDSSDSNHYSAYTVSGASLVANTDYDVYLNKITSSRYPAITYCNNYTADGVETGTCFLADATDGWDLFVQRDFMKKACDKIVGNGSFTNSNCYPYQNGTWYWASAENSQASAWLVNTSYASVLGWYGKWYSNQVRPVFAITV